MWCFLYLPTGPDAYQHFIDGLMYYGYEHIAQQLQETDVSDGKFSGYFSLSLSVNVIVFLLGSPTNSCFFIIMFFNSFQYFIVCVLYFFFK